VFSFYEVEKIIPALDLGVAGICQIEITLTANGATIERISANMPGTIDMIKMMSDV
jgi:hypothetical protein